MGKNEEYKKELAELGNDFSAEHGVYISKKFDPRRWLRSFGLDAKFKGQWPRKVDENTSLLAFKIGVKSEEHNCWYATMLEYGRATNLPGKIIPSNFRHTCDDNLYNSLTCKHTYRALSEADKYLMVKDTQTTFTPHDDMIEAYSEIETSRKSAQTKLAETFCAMEENLRLNERKKLSVLNARIDYLKTF